MNQFNQPPQTPQQPKYTPEKLAVESEINSPENMDSIPNANTQEAPQVDIKAFFDEQELSLINEIIRLEDLGQGNGEGKPIEKLKKSLIIQLQEMVNFLSTTEENQSVALAYYTELYRECFDQIKNANSIEDIAKAFRKMKFEDISARFYGTIKGNWKTLGTLKRRGVKTIKDPLQEPSVNRIFTKVQTGIQAFQIMKKAMIK